FSQLQQSSTNANLNIVRVRADTENSANCSKRDLPHKLFVFGNSERINLPATILTARPCPKAAERVYHDRRCPQGSIALGAASNFQRSIGQSMHTDLLISDLGICSTTYRPISSDAVAA